MVWYGMVCMIPAVLVWFRLYCKTTSLVRALYHELCVPELKLWALQHELCVPELKLWTTTWALCTGAQTVSSLIWALCTGAQTVSSTTWALCTGAQTVSSLIWALCITDHESWALWYEVSLYHGSQISNHELFDATTDWLCVMALESWVLWYDHCVTSSVVLTHPSTCYIQYGYL
jgi:hypothetical protein